MLKTIGALSAAMLITLPAHAHHSFSASFTDEVITVEGVVDEYKFANPHVVVYFNVTDDDGEVTRWMTEGLAATLLRRQGWSRDSISKGDTIRVSGNSSRNGSPMVSTDSLEFIDPATGNVTGTPAGDVVASKAVTILPMTLADGRPSLDGAWTRGQAQAGGNGGGMAAGGMGRVAGGMGNGGGMGGRAGGMPYNEEGAALQALHDPKNDPQVHCEAPGLVRQTATPHSVKIDQQDDRVVITSEEFGVERTVYFDDRDLVGGDEETNLGQSKARYEDEKLIIETTHLLSNLTGPGGNALSDQTTTVETYTRNEDANGESSLTMNMVVTDPGYLTEEWSRSWTKSYNSTYELVSNDCQKPLAE